MTSLFDVRDLKEANEEFKFSNLELHEILIGTLKSFAAVIRIKDPYTASH
jgi:hypothetical protein